MTRKDTCRTENLRSPDKTAYLMDNLFADTYYKVEVRAHNDIGFSVPSELVFKTAIGEYLGVYIYVRVTAVRIRELFGRLMDGWGCAFVFSSRILGLGVVGRVINGTEFCTVTESRLSGTAFTDSAGSRRSIRVKRRYSHTPRGEREMSRTSDLIDIVCSAPTKNRSVIEFKPYFVRWIYFSISLQFVRFKVNLGFESVRIRS